MEASPADGESASSTPGVSGSGAVVEAEGRPAAPPLELDQLRSFWPAVLDAVREENAMVAALLTEAQPAELDAGRLAVDFPSDAEFSKRKAESNADRIEAALRALTGHALKLELRLSGDSRAEPIMLSEEELLARLKAEFDAREVFDDPSPSDDESPATDPDSPATNPSPTDQD